MEVFRTAYLKGFFRQIRTEHGRGAFTQRTFRKYKDEILNAARLINGGVISRLGFYYTFKADSYQDRLYPFMVLVTVRPSQRGDYNEFQFSTTHPNFLITRHGLDPENVRPFMRRLETEEGIYCLECHNQRLTRMPFESILNSMLSMNMVAQIVDTPEFDEPETESTEGGEP